MSTMSSLKTLLSPSKSGSYFASFRTRSANPDGFDTKMKVWISAIEEWSVETKRLKLTIDDIHSDFVSHTRIRPDKECLRLVFSEMKRRCLIAPLKDIKSSKMWCPSQRQSTILDDYMDSNGWLSWGVTKLITWAQTSLPADEIAYLDLTDLTITNDMVFVCFASLNEISQNLLTELEKISKAERQICFELDHLLELITPILNTIIDADDKELLQLLDLILDYLAINNKIAMKVDTDTRLVKIPKQDEKTDVEITQKDVALARLLRAKETLTNDLDRYIKQAQITKEDAAKAFQDNEVAKAKCLLRSNKRYSNCVEQKEAQIRNVEELIDTLEETNSQKIVIDAYKEGAIALAMANMSINESRQELALPLTPSNPSDNSNCQAICDS